MISAVVIDDEVAIREGMLRHIRWKKLGVDQVVAIDSAEKAAEYLETDHPNLVISDIRLPKMDGIQLAELIREKQLDCRIIFMSAYTDLEYFRGAIRLSVEAYIEKPIVLEKMEQEIWKAVQKLQEGERRRETEALAQNIIEQHTEERNRCVLKKLFRGCWDAALMEKRNHDEPWIRQDDRFLCIIVKARGSAESGEAYGCKALELYFGALRHVVCAWESNVTVCLLAFTKNEFLTGGSELLEKFQADFQKERAGRDIAVVISEQGCGWQEVPALYQQAVCQMQRLFFVGYNHLLLPENGEPRVAEKKHVPFRAVAEALDRRDEGEVLRLTEQIYHYLQEQDGTLPAIVKNIFYQLGSMVLYKMDGGRLEKFAGEEEVGNFIWFRISNFETIAECYTYLVETIGSCFRNEEEFVYDNRAVNGAIRYIRDHFQDPDLSVQEIAESVHLTPKYMTGIFKKKTGITIGQFLRQMRLDHSKRLLQTSELSLSRIAELSGYIDENYWAKVYKKEYGQNPSEVRKRMRG